MEENTCGWYDPGCALAWVRDELQAFSLWLWGEILSGMASVFESFPVPDFLMNIGVHTMPDSVSWAASAFHLEMGLAVIVSAYTARFILRRIPVIG